MKRIQGCMRMTMLLGALSIMCAAYVLPAVAVLTALAIGLPGCGSDSERSGNPRRAPTYPSLMSDIGDRRLFGFTLGKPVPKECHCLIGDKVKYCGFTLWPGDTGANMNVAYDLKMEPVKGYPTFRSGDVLVDRDSTNVVGVCVRFFWDRNDRLEEHVKKLNGDYGIKDYGIIKWKRPSPPGDLYWDLLADFFERFGACETELGCECWDSGNIYQTKFVVADDLVVELVYHQQFGNELLIHVKDVKGARRRLWKYERVKNGSWSQLMGKHPAESWYNEYADKRARSAKNKAKP